MPFFPVPKFGYPVNLLSDSSVVTKDGAFIGSWSMDDSGGTYKFIPDGETEAVLRSAFKAELSRMIGEWLEQAAGSRRN